MKQNLTTLQQELLRQIIAGNDIRLGFSVNSHVDPMSLVGFLHSRGISASYTQAGGYITLKAKLNPTGDAA